MNSPSTAPGDSFRRDARPPIAPDSASSPGAVDRSGLRRTVWPRRVISPVVWPDSGPGYPVGSSYVRMFYTALLGPGAVADLLRLATAAARGRSLLRPIGLGRLSSAGLVREHAGRVEVRVVIPMLAPHQLQTLPPAVRRLHQENCRGDGPVPAPAA